MVNETQTTNIISIDRKKTKNISKPNYHIYFVGDENTSPHVLIETCGYDVPKKWQMWLQEKLLGIKWRKVK